MLARLDAALNTLYRLAGYAAAVCMVLIAVMVTLSIVTRLLSVYIPGLTEYSGYAMAAGSFLALAYTFSERGHIRVELVLSRLEKPERWIAEIWCLAVAALVTLFLAWYMVRLVYFSWKFEERSEGADAILLWQPQSLVMAGAVVLAIAVLHNLVKCLGSRDYQTR
jgi:TRAP-type C4-dicarboxylate transport system permease small subunit